MGFLITFLTFLLLVDCVVLVFLVLIQLPKKEAGAGLAFGGAASDALFGAGSGNVLTKITKYAAGIFFVMAVILSILQGHHYGRAGSSFQRKLEQPLSGPGTTLPGTPGKGAALPPPLTSSTNLAVPQPEVSTNAPAPAAATPEAPKK
ncbi:MAG TPA: preprotein translocase subunit SecG [Verrucomicrobiae bacterium]|nr:preprotein translocase subunit SecG [Verrucomicrobiae bacterium]